MLPEER